MRGTKQLPLSFSRRGGARIGAGRKQRRGPRKVPHRARPQHPARLPVHVTLRVLEDLPSLRGAVCFRALRGAFAKGRDRFGFRLVQFTVLGNHLHLIVEAQDKRALSRGLQGLGIRMARALNRALGRKGRVFADHYHAHTLREPREVANALAYVRENFRLHQHRSGRWLPPPRWIDPRSSAANPGLTAPAATFLLSQASGAPRRPARGPLLL